MSLIEEMARGALNLAIAEDVVEAMRGERPPALERADAEADELIAALIHCVHVLQIPGSWVESLLNESLGLEVDYTRKRLAEDVQAVARDVFISRSFSIIEASATKSHLARQVAQVFDLWAIEGAEKGS